MELKNKKIILNECKKCFEELTDNEYCDFEECVLEFLPYKKNEYLIYNKRENIEEGKLSLIDLNNAKKMLEIQHYEFSGITLQFDGNWNERLPILKEALEKKIYVICSDIEKVASYYKIVELKEYMKNIKIFKDIKEYKEYFHRNISLYLPRVIVADKDKKYEISQILRNEHKYRLTKEGRSNDNILLTIGIPTHNRGNLLLKRLKNLLRLQYDAEIEILAVKNGNALYREEYEKASQINDARFVYYGTDRELKPQLNWLNVVNYSHGKYILFVSDEDDVVLSSLEHYLKIISLNPQLSIVRASTSLQNKYIDNIYGEKGIDAFLKVFLKQNYLSGLIIHREKMIEANVLKYEKMVNNAFYLYYPHEWWCAELAVRGDCYYDIKLLIEERESVLEELPV